MIKDLLKSVAQSRQKFIEAASGLSFEQSQFKPSVDEWSIAENIEHMVWAEMGGINGMWKTLEGIKCNKPIWSGDAIHHGKSIEEIIEKTWKEKEIVPEIAKPKWFGPVEFWIVALNNCQIALEALTNALEGFDPEQIIYPHVLSGPLNVIQRFEFLSFHLDRHRNQIENIKKNPNFPQ